MAVDYAALEAAYKSGDPAKIKAANQSAHMTAASSGGMNDTMKMMEMNQLQQSQQMYQNQYKDAGAKFTSDAKAVTDKKAAEEAVAASKAAENANAGTRAVSAQTRYDDQGRPIRNDYLSIRDKDGNLNSQFSLADKVGPDVELNSQGLNTIRDRALSQGPSAWANLAMEKQGLEQSNLMDQTARQGASAQTQAFNSLRSRGGMSSGQRERLALQGQRQGAAASQGVMNQGLLNRSNILLQDQQSKDNMLMQLPGMDMNAANFQQGQRAFNAQTQQFDIGNKLKDVGGYNQYNADAFNKSSEIYGAEKTAQAQANASSGGGGCCFIFLEARYGNGAMDGVVRRFRDENMTAQNKRGYYKLSEVLVPVMRKSKLAKLAVRALMTDPMVAYGKAHYGEGTKLGFVFKPVVKFWLRAFDYLGGDHAFIRENGETI